MEKDEIELLKICIRNARVYLEMGGKYNWCEEFAQCDWRLELALRILGDKSLESE